MPLSAPQRFDADPSAYAEYLRTPLGRLRSELSWGNLEPHLPRPGTPPPRALDLGAGTGEVALRLAALGWSVTLVDGSRRMLERAAEAAAAQGIGERIACRVLDLDARGLAEALGGAVHDLVVCHHVLEYVDSAEALLLEARAALAAGGCISVVVRNRVGELMKGLLRGVDPEATLAILETRRVREELYGIDLRPFDLGELRALLGGVGLQVVVERGVRVASDHMAGWAEGGAGTFEQMLTLEGRLGDSPDLRAVARYLQVIAALGDASTAR